MATEWTDMESSFNEMTEGRECSPTAHYDSDADALTFFLSNQPEHRKRLNSRVTIFGSSD